MIHIIDPEYDALSRRIGELIAQIDQLIIHPDQAAEHVLIEEIHAMKDDAYEMLEKRGHLPVWAIRGDVH